MYHQKLEGRKERDLNNEYWDQTVHYDTVKKYFTKMCFYVRNETEVSWLGVKEEVLYYQLFIKHTKPRPT